AAVFDAEVVDQAEHHAANVARHDVIDAADVVLAHPAAQLVRFAVAQLVVVFFRQWRPPGRGWVHAATTAASRGAASTGGAVEAVLVGVVDTGDQRADRDVLHGVRRVHVVAHLPAL